MFDGAHKHVDMVLACLLVFQFCLFLLSLRTNGIFGAEVMWEAALHMAFLVALAGVFFVHKVHQKKLRQGAESNQEQIDAMFNMIGIVKHKLNNDMQVVLGNAELAEILLDAGGNASKAVQNVSDAAYNANERIEQLAVINAMRNSVPTDKSLLCLSLTHLIRQASINMSPGGGVIVRTRKCEYNNSPSEQSDFIIAEIHMGCIRINGSSNDDVVEAPDCVNLSHFADALQTDFDTSKAIVERSGVQSVRLSRTNDESLFSMRFYTSAQTKPASAKEKLLGRPLFRRI